MDGLEDFLRQRKLVPAKKAPYYANWVRKFLTASHPGAGAAITEQHINHFLEKMSGSYESWQVSRADEALRLFLFFRSRVQDSPQRDRTAGGSAVTSR